MEAALHGHCGVVGWRRRCMVATALLAAVAPGGGIVGLMLFFFFFVKLQKKKKKTYAHLVDSSGPSLGSPVLTCENHIHRGPI
jgi:hypothetical protein